MMLQSLLLSLSLICSALSVFAYSSPPSGAITVGKGGKYATLTQALADKSSNVYFVYGGTYKEQVVINRSGVKVRVVFALYAYLLTAAQIYGQTNTDKSYTGNREHKRNFVSCRLLMSFRRGDHYEQREHFSLNLCEILTHIRRQERSQRRL